VVHLAKQDVLTTARAQKADHVLTTGHDLKADHDLTTAHDQKVGRDLTTGRDQKADHDLTTAHDQKAGRDQKEPLLHRCVGLGLGDFRPTPNGLSSGRCNLIAMVMENLVGKS
jgi:hypothetical protein